MKKLFLLFNHEVTDEQIKDAKESLGVDEFVALPDKMQNIWSNTSPFGDLPVSELNEIISWLNSNAQKGDYVLVQGDFGATFYVVDFCLKNGLTPIYATTERISVDKKDIGGKIIKRSIFKHVTFRKYRYF